MAQRDRQIRKGDMVNSRSVAHEILDSRSWSREIRHVAKDYFAPVTAVANTVVKGFSGKYRDAAGEIKSRRR